RIAEPPQYRKSRRRRERVPGERPRLVDVVHRGESLHQVRPAAECSERKPATDDLAEHGQIRPYAEALLRAATGDAEAGDHLVEDEQGAGRVAEPAQRLEESRLGRNDAHV